ncbi:MAG TPA: MarR family transcriptional regulator [Mycobacteriales bacterium]|nr:MarR family transcriptional regulator [Mycobacteriales bacterium]
MPSTAMSRSDAALAGALRDAIGRLGRRMRHHASHPELSLGQLAALRSLERHGPMSPTELATHEKVQPPSMTKIVGRLLELGYVSRAPHAADRRQVVVTISAAGVALLEDDRRRRDAWIARQMRDLTHDEVAALRSALPVLEKLSRS